MKRYAAFTARFVLAPIVSGTFVVSATGRASALEWAHLITGVTAIYLIFGLVLLSAKYREIRLPAYVALAVGILEAIPGIPRLHAVIAPILFAALVWAVMALPRGMETARGKPRLIFVLPALVLLPIIYGVGYRHQTSGFLPHILAAMPVAGMLVVVCVVLNQRHLANTKLRRVCNQLIAVILLQIVFGIVVFIIRLLELEGGLLLAIARTAHITGAAPVLGICTALAIQYRRTVAHESP